jgi:hypothetical protein
VADALYVDLFKLGPLALVEFGQSGDVPELIHRVEAGQVRDDAGVRDVAGDGSDTGTVECDIGKPVLRLAAAAGPNEQEKIHGFDLSQFAGKAAAKEAGCASHKYRLCHSEMPNSLLAGSVNHQIMAHPFREPSQLHPELV